MGIEFPLTVIVDGGCDFVAVVNDSLVHVHKRRFLLGGYTAGLAITPYK